MMKMVLFTNYGGIIPDALKAMLKPESEYPYSSRYGEIVDKIESTAKTLELNDGSTAYDVQNTIKSNPDTIFRIVSATILPGETLHYAGWNAETRVMATFDIVEIDETKRWTITEYDGAERIVELSYKQINPELNLWVNE